MTILFYTRFRPVNEKGGTEHTTQVVADGLRRLYGIHSIATWQLPFEGTMKPFDAEYQIPRDHDEATDAVEKIIREHGVGCVIVQGYFHDAPALRDAVRRVRGCHIIFAHHFAPGWEKLNKNAINQKIQQSRGFKRLRYRLKLQLFPLFLLQSKANLIKRYFLAYRQAEKVVVLSQHYIRPFQKLALTHDSSKFVVIPNAVPFSHISLPPGSKEKMVLMVTRLDERQKRISLALRIWAKVKADPRFADWQLVVIGDGYYNESAKYRQWAQDNGIPQVTFLGRRNPMDYYRRASVFMLTSLFEGLPLTVLESRMADVVPIAFNTFGAVYDIIHDCHDGFIVNDGDIDGYVSRLQQLMSDEPLREDMAKMGVGSTEPFSEENVMEKWYKLLVAIQNS